MPHKSPADRRAYALKYYHKHPTRYLVYARLRRKKAGTREKDRKKERRYRERIRAKILELFGSKCNKCGFDSDKRILQLDHLNGGGHAEERKLGIMGVRRNALKNPGKYQLLCPNCNWIKRFDNGEHNQPMDLL